MIIVCFVDFCSISSPVPGPIWCGICKNKTIAWLDMCHVHIYTFDWMPVRNISSKIEIGCFVNSFLCPLGASFGKDYH